MQVREAFRTFAVKHKIRNLNIQTFMFIQNCCLIVFSSYKIVFTTKTSGTNTRNHHTFGIYRQVLSKMVSILHSQSFCSLWNVSLDSTRALSDTVRNNLTEWKWWISRFHHSFLTIFENFELWALIRCSEKLTDKCLTFVLFYYFFHYIPSWNMDNTISLEHVWGNYCWG